MSQEAPRTQATVKLLNLIDVERGASLRAESTAVAVSVARKLSERMTRAERTPRTSSSPTSPAPCDGPPTATLCRLPIVLIMAGHGRWRRRPGITGYVGTPPCPASSHDRDAGAAKGDDLLIPAHRPREA